MSNQDITAQVVVDEVSLDLPMDKAFAINQARTESMISQMANAVKDLTAQVEELAQAVHAKNDATVVDPAVEIAVNKDEEKKEDEDEKSSDDQECKESSKNEVDEQEKEENKPDAKNVSKNGEAQAIENLFGFNSKNQIPTNMGVMSTQIRNELFS